MKNLKVKVCGMRDPQNILDLATLGPDFMGFIFYAKSPRNVLAFENKETIRQLPAFINKTGVFVDESAANIEKYVGEFDLNTVQLHGHETPETCAYLKTKNLRIIKAFGLHPDFDFNSILAYQDHIDLFLFDTKAPGHGGSGEKFDWRVLEKYNQRVPFFIAGGLSSDNLSDLDQLKNMNLYGIDLNSKFEVMPGFKNIENLKKIIRPNEAT
jgi:phosphoribosylanthranilate isomerase